ncbi:MAG TPA: DNA-3-methyladenine glycosylase 2 family protein [Candidatus Dormibacteraeota bacterium]|nr:DNA-3-methyladenine glycosylase 2 family protein [Candidatus Dormibacteraeota bacterium]
MVAAIGPPRLRPPQETAFAALVRAIVYQQLAGRAAAAIHGRFEAALSGGLTPEAVLALPEPAFRAAGLSGAKTASIRDLATKVSDGTVPLLGIEALTDDEVVERLSLVRGIGRWTAEMFLVFQLRRPDVWPVDDLGVRRGYALLQGLAAPPSPRELLALGDVYRPFRTVAAWYCWRSAETVLPSAPPRSAGTAR